MYSERELSVCREYIGKTLNFLQCVFIYVEILSEDELHAIRSNVIALNDSSVTLDPSKCTVCRHRVIHRITLQDPGQQPDHNNS